MRLLKLATPVVAAASILAIQETLIMGVTPLLSESTAQSLAALGSHPALAAPSTGLRYQLPKTRKLTSTQGAGSRGGTVISGQNGDKAWALSLELLVPRDHMALTTSGRPTFFWYFSHVPDFPVEFALYQQGIAKPLLIQRVNVEKAGIVQLTIPQNVPELKPDATKKYRWSISLIRSEDELSTNPTCQAWIQRVPVTPDQLKQLKTAKTNRDRAIFYAQSGFWYDSLNEIASDYINQPNDPNLKADMTALLDQVEAGLSKKIMP